MNLIARRSATRVSLLAALFALFASSSSAQVSVNATIQVDKTELRTGDVLRLIARAEVDGANLDDFRLPDLDGFAVRSRSVQRSMQLFGNRQRPSTVYTLLLEAQRPGSFDIGPVVAIAGGREGRSDIVRITVSGEATTPAQPAQPQEPAVDGDGYVYNERAFLRTIVTNTRPYVGERTEVRVLLYISERSGDINLIQDVVAEGFWIEDLQNSGSRPAVQRQRIQGRSFAVHEIRRLAAYPLREGELVIGAPEVSIGATRSLASLFGGGGGRGGGLRPLGQPVAVTARALPEPVPSRMIVGSATLETRVDREQVRTGDAVTVTAVVRSRGRLAELRLRLPEQQGLRVLEPQVQDRPSSDGSERVFEWIVVPEAPGNYRFPGLTFQMFDPENGRYSVVRAPELSFEAAGNSIAPAEPEQPVVQTAESRESNELQLEGLRNHSELRRSYPPLSATPLFWAGVVVPPVLFFFVVVAGLIRRRGPSIEKIQRSKRKRRLTDAEDARRSGDARTFYAAIDAALVEAIDARFDVRASGMAQAELSETLLAGGLGEEDTTAVLREREACDFARFSSTGGADEEMARCLERTRTLLHALDHVKEVPS